MNHESVTLSYCGLDATSGREMLYRPAEAVIDLESVGHRVTIFLVPGDKKIRSVDEARVAAQAVIVGNIDHAQQ